jgi:hypothetical protein
MTHKGHMLCNGLIFSLKQIIFKISTFFHPCVKVDIHNLDMYFISSIFYSSLLINKCHLFSYKWTSFRHTLLGDRAFTKNSKLFSIFLELSKYFSQIHPKLICCQNSTNFKLLWLWWISSWQRNAKAWVLKGMKL